MALAALLVLYVPPAWTRDLGPFPDAEEYATTAWRLAHMQPFGLVLMGQFYPSRYPFGFPALIAPAYWFPHATLATGIVGVAVWGSLAVTLTYALGRLLAGRWVGLAAAAALLLLPLFLSWNHEIMSESASMALAAAAAVALCRAATCESRRARVVCAALAGGAAGLATLVHIINGVYVVAVLVALLAIPASGRLRIRLLLAGLIGPLCAIGALAVYNSATFGGIMATGYRYWEPGWYSSIFRTFSLSYALHAPGAQGDYDPAVGSIPNLVYFARTLTGLFPHSREIFLPKTLWPLAVVGAIVLLRDRRPAVRAVCVYGVVLTLLTLTVAMLYYYQSVRFLAALAPLAALCIGAVVVRGVHWLREGLRRRRLGAIVLGGALVVLTLAGLRSTVPPLAQGWYLLGRVAHPSSLTPPAAPNDDGAAAYRSVAGRGMVVTTVSPAFLNAYGITNRDHVVPLIHGAPWSYWDMRPFLQVPALAQQPDLLYRALHRHVEVLTDSYSLGQIQSPGQENEAARHILARYHLQPIRRRHGITIYRIVKDGGAG